MPIRTVLVVLASATLAVAAAPSADSPSAADRAATKRQGWPDIEVGGPGFGKFPVRHWNGRTYK